MNRKGFTLIELLIVVVIIGILAAIAIPKFANTKQKAVLASMKSDMRNMVTAQEAFFSDNNTLRRRDRGHAVGRPRRIRPVQGQRDRDHDRDGDRLVRHGDQPGRDRDAGHLRRVRRQRDRLRVGAGQPARRLAVLLLRPDECCGQWLHGCCPHRLTLNRQPENGS